VIGFWLTGFMGVIGVILSLAWIAQICLYMLPANPVSPMLNAAFVLLDNAWALLGVIFFSIFCLYLMGGFLSEGLFGDGCCHEAV